MIKKLNEALLDSYDKNSLERFVKFELDEDLGQLVGSDGDLTSQVFHLVEWAERNGRLSELLSKAREDRPNGAFQDIDLVELSSSARPKYTLTPMVDLRIIDHRVTILAEEFKEFRAMIIGSDGVKMTSDRNKEKLDDVLSSTVKLAATIDRLDSIVARQENALEWRNKEFDSRISRLEKRMEGHSPEQEAVSSALLVFVVVSLSCTTGLLILQSLGWF